MMRWFSFIFVFFFSAVGFAAGPILVDTEATGKAVIWQDGRILYNPETMTNGVGGTLGYLDNEEARALVADLFSLWENITLFNGETDVRTVEISIVENGGLGNVDTTNLDDFFTYCPPMELCLGTDPPFVIGSAHSGISPIIFDEDGNLTDMILGVGARDNILGFAGPRVVERDGSDLFIMESQAVFNGRFIDCPEGASLSDPCQIPEVEFNSFKAAIFHELGHFLGLDHSQVNFSDLSAAIGGDYVAAENITTMSPLFVGETQLMPHYDDKVSISSLYPSEDFLIDFCAIEGEVFRLDGNTPLQGVNVIARRVDKPRLEATSFVSGSFFTGETDCSEPFGDFVLYGIKPGVDYTLEIEPISFSFRGGSSIEPCDPPQSGFEAQMIPGFFSCNSGGLNITMGSVASTDIVTTKTLETGGVDVNSLMSSGCQLMVNRGAAAGVWGEKGFFPSKGSTFLLVLFLLLLCLFAGREIINKYQTR